MQHAKKKKKRLNYMIKLAVLNTTNVDATFQIALIIIIITFLSVLKFNFVFFHVVKQQLCSSTEKKKNTCHMSAHTHNQNTCDFAVCLSKFSQYKQIQQQRKFTNVISMSKSLNT